MSSPISFRLLPEPDVHDVLQRTLERVNKACNGARTRILEGRVTGKAELKSIVKQEMDKFKLPATLSTAASDRVALSLAKQKFGTYQSLVFPAGSVKWPASDRVNVPTAGGKRTIRVYLDPSRGSLRPPLEGRPTALVFRNGEFDLVDATVDPNAPAGPPPWERS